MQVVESTKPTGSARVLADFAPIGRFEGCIGGPGRDGWSVPGNTVPLGKEFSSTRRPPAPHAGTDIMHESDADRTHAPTDRDHYETSPSCDYRTVAEVMGCPNAHAVEEDPTTDADAVDDLEDTTMFSDTSPTPEVAQ